jgi:hypothetical protein
MVKDHTKSLIPYQKILEDLEDPYRHNPEQRGDIINQIIAKISKAAAQEGAEIAGGEVLIKVSILSLSFTIAWLNCGYQQIINYYVNHRTVAKEEETPPIKTAKQWNARLVADHLYHKEIQQAVEAFSDLTPKQKIGKWAACLTDKINSLPEDERAKLAVLAEQWRDKGPPEEIKRK